MRSQETLFYLEMTGPGELTPARSALPNAFSLAGSTDLAHVRAVTLAIGAPYDWPSQHWDDQRWMDYFSTRDLRHWIAELDGEPDGLVSLRFDTDEVELDTFGLVPTFTGRGLGSALLTMTVELAWQEAPRARRLWLHTSSHDHPAALPNYLSRGFRLYRTMAPGDR